MLRYLEGAFGQNKNIDQQMLWDKFNSEGFGGGDLRLWMRGKFGLLQQAPNYVTKEQFGAQMLNLLTCRRRMPASLNHIMTGLRVYPPSSWNAGADTIIDLWLSNQVNNKREAGAVGSSFMTENDGPRSPPPSSPQKTQNYSSGNNSSNSGLSSKSQSRLDRLENAAALMATAQTRGKRGKKGKGEGSKGKSGNDNRSGPHTKGTGACFVCGKTGHKAAQCSHRKGWEFEEEEGKFSAGDNVLAAANRSELDLELKRILAAFAGRAIDPIVRSDGGSQWDLLGADFIYWRAEKRMLISNLYAILHT